MKVPLNWLKQYVEIPDSVTELTDKLTAIGHMQDKKPEKIGDDTVIDLEVRQNRSDCYSILGVAREVAAVTGKQFRHPDPAVAGEGSRSNKLDSSTPKAVQNDSELKITNTDPDLCKRFKAVRIKLAARSSQLTTPDWMKSHLEAYGIKVISPVVDITNYVMVETGEPMHAFDIRAIKDAHIMIRSAKENEKLTVLGGKELTLTSDDLVIADDAKILSFSGLIGGEGTGISADTTEFVLEAASYNQAVIRRSSIRHGVRTEASTRHEKFLDPRLVDVALERALSLLSDMTEYEIIATAESYPEPVQSSNITLRSTEVSRLGGIELSQDVITQILKSLGFEVTFDIRLSTFNCVVPYWRTDILCEADLVEEALRLYGYENIPASLPPFAPPADISAYAYRLDDEIRDVMQKIEFDEVMTEPLTSTSRYDELSRMEKGLRPVKLQNALNADKSMLRFVMDEGLRHALTHHQKFGKSTIKLFELGKVYSESTDQNSKQKYHEPRHAAFVLHDIQCGKENIYRQSKGIVEMLCRSLGISYTDEIANFHMWDEHTVYTCMNLEHNFAQSRRMIATSKARLYTSIPRTQSFDISCLLPQVSKVGEIISSIQNEITTIESINIPELPRKQDNSQKSVLFHIILKDDAADKAKISKQVEAHLRDRHKATIR